MHVALQGTGNDASKRDSKSILSHFLSHYETLIHAIRCRCPDATVVLCKIPRRGKVKNVATINNINANLNIFVDPQTLLSDMNAYLYKRENVIFHFVSL